MSQTAGRPCPTCGNMVPAGQRFCSNCGTDLSRVQAPSQHGGFSPQQFPQGQQVPPYAQAPFGQQQPPYQPPRQQSNPLAEAFGALGLLFLLRRYRPGYVPRRQSSGCCGCLFVLVILVLILGVPGYIVYRNAGPNFIHQVQTNVSNNNQGNPATQQPITTTQLNERVSYGGIDMTLLNAQQASAFSDDSSSSTNGMVRLNLREQAGARVNAFIYSDAMRLILPDKTTGELINAQHSISPDLGTVRTNWVDFAVSTRIKVNQLVLSVGNVREAQMEILLSSTANLAAFQPKTAHPHAATRYDGMTWTLSSTTLAWSYDGKQADKGTRNVAVQLRIDNPTSRSFVAGFPDAYMRLKAGDTTSPPIGRTTLPTTIDASSSGATGVVAFQVPEGVTSFTLILLGNSNVTPPYAQATIAFQIK